MVKIADEDRADSVLRFTPRELVDFTASWVLLSLAFTLFFESDGIPTSPTELWPGFGIVLLTVGVGFLLHEAAHKVTAVRFGQSSVFRAHYGMLLLAIAGGLAGFIFAVPGAVYHEGRLTNREHGLIALAGPVTNIALAVLFFPLLWVAPHIGFFGVGINTAMAVFNLLPFGPLDGKDVRAWSGWVHAASLAVAISVGGVPLVFLF